MSHFHSSFRVSVLVFAIAGWFSISQSVSIPTTNISVSYGKDVNLTCNAQENEDLWVRWDKEDNGHIIAMENHVIIDDPRISVSLTHNNTWILSIKKVQAEDQGSYRCTISNDRLQRTLLEVVDVPVAPTIVVSPGDASVRERSTISLTCYATGHPKPTITWTRDDGKPIHMWANHTLPFPIGITDSRWEAHSVKSFEGETLTLSRISRRDAGPYKCTANNSANKPVSEVIQLRVLYPPAAVHVRGPKEARAGDKVAFSCHALDSMPSTKISWIVEGKPKHAVSVPDLMSKDGGYETISDLSFVVPTMHAQGEIMLTCIAVNRELGTKNVDSYILHILERDKSEPTPSSPGHRPRADGSGHHGHLVPALIGTDINPKRGEEKTVDPPRRRNNIQGRTAYHDMIGFLRFFGLLMHFH